MELAVLAEILEWAGDLAELGEKAHLVAFPWLSCYRYQTRTLGRKLGCL